MNIVLTAINAKFIYSSLALPSLKAYSGEVGKAINILEFTINNREDLITKKIFMSKPDILCFSCYIWNINIIKSVAQCIKKLFPHIILIFGGPEVSYCAAEFLKENQFADIIIMGEGEKTFKQLLEFFMYDKNKLENIRGISYRKNGIILKNEPQEAVILDEIPFVYENLDLYQNKIIYYETQRGCPYSCQYCLSSIEKGVRFLSVERVKRDLNLFIKNNMKQVKFVDRTFNCNRSHAVMIWKHIMENDNGFTNFHMEITGDILDDSTIEMLKYARKGLFQFEIGIQSTNKKTLEEIKRNTDLKKLFENIKKIKEKGNIHCHLDLIAGLPYEDYDSFKGSFNNVYSLIPEQFQLGFLKLLKGSGLSAKSEELGIIYNQSPPYEVLYTKDISFYDILKLKNIEDIVEIYYNSGKAVNTIGFCMTFFKTAFDFYEALGDYWEQMGYFDVNHNKIELYIIFFEFVKNLHMFDEKLDIIKDFIRLDIFINDNIKNIPEQFYREPKLHEKERIRNFYADKNNVKEYMPELLEFSAKQLERMCHIELFDFDILDISKEGLKEFSKKETAVLFDYWERDSILNKAVFYKINL